MLSSRRGPLKESPQYSSYESLRVWNYQDDPECTILCVNVFQAGLPSSVLRPKSIRLNIKPRLLQLNLMQRNFFKNCCRNVLIKFWDNVDDGGPAQPSAALWIKLNVLGFFLRQVAWLPRVP